MYLKDSTSIDGYISKQIPGETVYMTTRYGIAVFPWDSVYCTEKLLQGDSCCGICEILVLTYGDTLKGRIVEQRIGQSVLFKQDGGVYMEINAPDIISIQSRPIADTLSVWDQIRFLDRLVLRDGTTADGFISSRVMGESVTILLRDSSVSRTYSLPEIKSYQKVVKDESVAALSFVQDAEVYRDTSGTACLILKIDNPSDDVIFISEENSGVVVQL